MAAATKSQTKRHAARTTKAAPRPARGPATQAAGKASKKSGAQAAGGAQKSSAKDRGGATTSAKQASRSVRGASELAKNKKRCVQVLNNARSFDRDLVALCRLVQMASR